MAIPPCYADLAKNVSDLFSKGYNFGDVKLDVSSSGAGNTSFKASATNHAQSDGSRRVSGNLEVKREVLRHGNLDVSLSSKFNSDRTVNTTLTANNVGADNLKGNERAFHAGNPLGGGASATLTLDGNFAPQTGKHTAKVKAAYKRPHLHVNEDVHLKSDGAVLSTAAVVKHCGFYLGYQGAFNQASSTLQDSNFSLGYSAGDVLLHTACLNHGARVQGRMHHAVNPKLEYGVALDWAAGNDSAQFGLATKYNCCPGVTLRSKFNSDGELGLSYKHELNSNVSVTLSGLVDTKALTLPAHRVGLGLDFSA